VDTLSAHYRTANRSASTERPPAPFFHLGRPAPLAHLRDCLKKCFATGLRAAFDGGDCFSLLEVRQPLVLSVTNPDPAIDEIAWAELAVTVIFEVPIDLLEGLHDSGGDTQ